MLNDIYTIGHIIHVTYIYIAGYTMIELTSLIRNTGGAWIHPE